MKNARTLRKAASLSFESLDERIVPVTPGFSGFGLVSPVAVGFFNPPSAAPFPPSSLGGDGAVAAQGNALMTAAVQNLNQNQNVGGAFNATAGNFAVLNPAFPIIANNPFLGFNNNGLVGIANGINIGLGNLSGFVGKGLGPFSSSVVIPPTTTNGLFVATTSLNRFSPAGPAAQATFLGSNLSTFGGTLGTTFSTTLAAPFSQNFGASGVFTTTLTSSILGLASPAISSSFSGLAPGVAVAYGPFV